MSKEKKHVISKVLPGSIAEEMGLDIGDGVTVYKKIEDGKTEVIPAFRFLRKKSSGWR